MSNCINDISYKFDAFMARDDVKRFNEVATSVLLATGRVALAALAVLGSIVFFGATIGLLVLSGMAFASGNVPAGIDGIIGAIGLGIFAIGFAGGIMPGVVIKAAWQCKETHQLIWGN